MMISREHIEYLQRFDRNPDPIPPMPEVAEVPVELRRLSRIRAVGMDRPAPMAEGAAQTPSSDLSISLYAARISVAYLVIGRGDAVEIYLGNWQRGKPDLHLMDVMNERQDMIVAGLKSLYPASYLDAVAANSMKELMGRLNAFHTCGFVLGLPSVKPAPWDRGSYPLDRVVRSLRGTDWACLLLAEPVGESLLNRERVAVIEELKDIPDVRRASDDFTPGKPEVLGAYYRELLSLRLETLTACLGAGAWRTAVYLLGDASYYRLASIWRGVFSGDDALLEPLRVWQADIGSLVAKWAMSNVEARPGPGRVRRLLEHQTILSSAQLAAYLHLPRVETNGFAIKHVASFGVAPQALDSSSNQIDVGKVLLREHLARPATAENDFEKLPDVFYSIRSSALAKHAFVSGVTGAGKTTTIFNILKQGPALNVPFLVIEPAKTEYRDLLHHTEIGERLQVFTVADEQVSPLRINPFEVLPGTSIAKHIDLLRSLFSASFGLWTPLPQILEECLRYIYQDRGWDLTNDSNPRLNDRSNPRDEPISFPTISDLLQKVDEVTSRLQWDPEAIARIRGSLRDRLRSLAFGARGRMLDVQNSLPMQALLEHPTVLELEAVGDDDDKAFLMGLFLIRLVEYRRSPEDKANAQLNQGLRHMLVIEEAHRLLTNVLSRAQEGAANPRTKAVETFANLLSEIRAYGQGVIVADQVPVKLAPDVIKNTNLKIAHRIVDLEDRKLLGGSMAMTEEQVEALSRLLPGTAAVYSEGDDRPLVVQVRPGPSPRPAKPENEEIRTHATRSSVWRRHKGVFLLHRDCTDVKENPGSACEASKALVAARGFQREFARLIFSLMSDTTAIDRLWAPIEAQVNSMVRPQMNRETMIRCTMFRGAEWYASRRGSQSGWSYTATQELTDAIYETLLERGQSKAQRLQDRLRELHRRPFDPYPECGRICSEQPPSCFYRHGVKDLIDRGDFSQQFREADPANPGEGKGPKFAWWACQRAAEQLVEWRESQRGVIQSIGMCFGQMMLSEDAVLMTPESRQDVFEALFNERENLTFKD